MFITTVGAFCWAIFCFVVHQIRSSRQQKDGHFHQSQALLRNSPSPTGSLKQFWKLGYAWSGKGQKSKRRVAWLSLVAIIHLGIFQIAALLANRIYDTNNEVLLRSRVCGKYNWDATDSERTLSTEAMLLSQRTTARWAMDYARTCYDTNATGSQCGGMVSKSLTRYQKIYYDQPCPFEGDICLDPQKGAVQIDSGLLDTNLDMGLNSRRGNSVGYRRVTTCAPLQTKGYTVDRSAVSGELTGDVYRQYNYGKQLNGLDGEEYSPYTFEESGFRRQLTNDPYSVVYVLDPISNIRKY